MNKLTTLCYIEKDNKYLMLHRIKKENDINHDKWIGVGGKFELGESPEECLLREVKEETGYTLTAWKYRGIITFVYGEDIVEYMSLFTADEFEGTPIDCNEGVLEWVEKERISELNLWEGDRIFFRLLEEREDFFSLKLVYDTEDVLIHAVLDGKELALQKSGIRFELKWIRVSSVRRKNTMKILVTGAHGFVGTRLMKELERAIAAPSIQGMNEKQIRQIVEESEADVIIHTAAISDVGICEKNPEESYYANVLLPVYLAKASDGRKLICFSSDQVYRGCESDGPYREDEAKPANIYGAHKLEMEQRVLDRQPDSVLLRAEWMYDYISPRGNYLLNVLNAKETLTFGQSVSWDHLSA